MTPTPAPSAQGADTPPNAVVLLSGGLDSATVLAIARGRGYACHTLTIDYGQRHRAELAAAEDVARHLGAASHRVVTLDLRAIGGSALTDSIAVPKDSDLDAGAIPVTYVPARNLAFFSIAAGYAEVLGAARLFVGVNAVDYSGYPDCRPEFLAAFQTAANLATKAGVEATARGPKAEPALTLEAPLIDRTKADIIRTGLGLGVDYARTISCYDPLPESDRPHAKLGTPGGPPPACGRCDACRLRRAGFEAAGVPDPTRYGA